jgi:ribosomal protein S18 acetylase RimI-like enzyme
MNSLVLRSDVRSKDRYDIRELLVSTGLFKPREIDVAIELIDDRLSKTKSEYLFIFADIEKIPVGYICYGPVTMTEFSYDIYWIAVRGDLRGEGIGTLLLKEAEKNINFLGGRRIYVETSSSEGYRLTEAFYRKQGYSQVARIPYFFSEDDDKLVFMKTIA